MGDASGGTGMRGGQVMQSLRIAPAVGWWAVVIVGGCLRLLAACAVRAAAAAWSLALTVLSFPALVRRRHAERAAQRKHIRDLERRWGL
jgi:hypothetical protein